MLSLLLVAATPAKAGTIHFADVLRAAAEGRRVSSAGPHVRAIQQQGGQLVASGVAPDSRTKGSEAGASSNATVNIPDTSTTGSINPSIMQDPARPQQGGQVETIDLGDVTGTVCDCGEIPVEDIPGGVPWWPLLGLAGIPLFFIGDGDKPPNTPPPPGTTPTPPTTPVPEPATLFLFGTSLLALGAGARRRRRTSKALNIDTDGAGEV
jgi:PEP-CTERM motif